MRTTGTELRPGRGEESDDACKIQTHPSLAFGVILGIPYLLRPAREIPPPNALQLVVTTPNTEAIRYEFGQAFRDWHRPSTAGPS